MKKALSAILIILFVFSWIWMVFWEEKDMQYIVTELYYSPDWKSLYYNTLKGNMMLNDKIIGKWRNFRFSPDSKNYAYISGSAWNMSVIKNWVVWNSYDYISDLKFSPDSQNLVYVASKNGQSFIVTNDTEWIKYSPISPLGEPTYSPDSKSFAYAIKKDRESYVVKDGVKGETYTSVNNLTFSPDSKSFAYNGLWKQGNVIIHDGVELGQWWGFQFSPDSKSFAYVAGKPSWAKIEPTSIVKDRKNLWEWFTFAFSPDSKSFAYATKKDGKIFVVKDGVAETHYNYKDYKYPDYQSYDQIKDLTFSPDSKSLAYVVVQNGETFIVKNGVEWNKYESKNIIKTLIFSPDSKSIEYTLETNDNGITKDTLKKDNTTLWEGLGFQFSPDSKSFAFVESQGFLKYFIIKDGENLGEWRLFSFSPDSKKFAYAVEKDGKDIVQEIINNSAWSDNAITNSMTSQKSFKILTPTLRVSVEKKLENMTAEQLNTLLRKLKILQIKSRNGTEKRKNLLSDIRIIIEEKLEQIK